MFRVVDDNDADGAWQKLAEFFLPRGPAVQQTGRNGQTSEVLHAAFSILNPRQRWIASRSPALNPAFAIAEVVWILAGRQDSAFLNYFNPSLPNFAGGGSTYGGAYGYRLRHHFGIDQLQRAFEILATDQNSRQVVLQIWDSRVDLPKEDATTPSMDIPCNVVAILKIRNRRLEWTQIMRSNDIFRGLPHNIVQFTSLQEILGGWLGLETGTYNHVSDSLHLYEKDGPMRERLQPIDMPPNSDHLALSKVESDQAFLDLSSFGDFVISDVNGPERIVPRLEELKIPPAYFNFAAILAAEALRRRGRVDLAVRTISGCTNPCLTFLFDRWIQRNRPKSTTGDSMPTPNRTKG
jgi:thymidylate synthase